MTTTLSHQDWVRRTAAKGWTNAQTRDGFARREACISEALDAGWYPGKPETTHLHPDPSKRNAR